MWISLVEIINHPSLMWQKGEQLCFVFLGIFFVAQFGVSMALPFDVADNRIMTTVSFVLSLGLVSLWSTFLYLKEYQITYREWAVFAGLVIVGVMKFLAMWYQLKLGYGGDNPFIMDYSFVPMLLGNAAFLAEFLNDRPNQPQPHHDWFTWVSNFMNQYVSSNLVI